MLLVSSVQHSDSVIHILILFLWYIYTMEDCAVLFFQSCLTLCDPMDSSTPCGKMCSTLCGPMDCSFLHGIFQEYQNGLLFPPPGDLPDPGIKAIALMSPSLAGGFFTTSANWEVHLCGIRPQIRLMCINMSALTSGKAGKALNGLLLRFPLCSSHQILLAKQLSLSKEPGTGPT